MIDTIHDAVVCESANVNATVELSPSNVSEAITVNVTAPLVDETVVDSIIPAIEKATRLNLA